MQAHEIVAFIRDRYLRGMTLDQCRTEPLARIDQETPHEQHQTLIDAAMVAAFQRSVKKGRLDAAEMARAIQEYTGADQVIVEEKPMSAQQAGAGACPVCRANLNSALPGSDTLMAPPNVGDGAICLHCGAALTFTDSGFRVMTTSDLGRISPFDRRNFWRAVQGIRQRLRVRGITPTSGPF